LTEPLNYSLWNTVIPEASSCKYLGMILRCDLYGADQVNYTVKKPGKHFIFQCGLLGSLHGGTDKFVRPGAKDSGTICTSYEQFELGNLDTDQADSSHMRSLQTYTGERAWRATGDRLQGPCYLCRGDHNKEIRSRKQRTGIGIYSFVNRTIQIWNHLPSDALGTLSCKPSNFRKRVFYC
jgi:hypothetical protein